MPPAGKPTAPATSTKPAAAPVGANGQPKKAEAAIAAAGALMAKLGNRLVEAHEKHKNETSVPVAGLPAGIRDGVAQLVQCYFKQYQTGDHKGEYFFMAAGIVKSPLDFNGRKVSGLRTQIGPEPICDTPKAQGKKKTLNDHLQWVYEQLRGLGVKTSELKVNTIEAAAAALVKVAPYFLFETWTSDPTPAYPNPKVNHKWLGVTTAPAAPVPGAGFKDASKPVTATTAPVSTVAPPASAPVEEPQAEESGESPGDEPAEGGMEYQEGLDIDSLLASAKANDGEAQTRLREHATAQGWTEEQVDGADTWDDLVGMIRSGPPVEEAEGEAAPEEGAAPTEPEMFTPDKDSVYLYRVRDKLGRPVKDGKTKTEKPPVECLCVKVNADRTCDLKNMDDGKTIYAKVPFDHLEDGK